MEAAKFFARNCPSEKYTESENAELLKSVLSSSGVEFRVKQSAL